MVERRKDSGEGVAGTMTVLAPTTAALGATIGEDKGVIERSMRVGDLAGDPNGVGTTEPGGEGTRDGDSMPPSRAPTCWATSMLGDVVADVTDGSNIDVNGGTCWAPVTSVDAEAGGRDGGNADVDGGGERDPLTVEAAGAAIVDGS